MTWILRAHIGDQWVPARDATTGAPIEFQTAGSALALIRKAHEHVAAEARRKHRRFDRIDFRIERFTPR